MIRHALRVLVVLGPTVALLTACTSAPDAAPSDAGQSPRAEEAAPTSDLTGAGPCDLLAVAVVEALTGEPVTEIERTVIGGVGGLPACHMRGETSIVQFARVPAADWSATVPAIIDQMRETGGMGAANQARLDEMAELATGEYDDLDACDLFSELAEFNGSPSGSDLTLAYAPNGIAPLAISAQSCADGIYSTLLFAGSDIEVSRDLEQEMLAGLDLVEAG